MGFFVLHPKDHKKAELAAFDAYAADHGFSLTHKRQIHGRTLRLYRNLSGNDPQVRELDDGGFAASFGSFFYRGDQGRVGLESLYRGFLPDSFDWEGLAGQFVALILKSDVLYVIGDGLGACKIFRLDGGGLISNSFVALASLGGVTAFDLQGCYEYVFAGSCYGTRTVVDGVSSVPPANIVSWDGTQCVLTQRADPIVTHMESDARPIATLAQDHAERLDQYFAPVVRHHGDRLQLSFSGGFDSRLVLATLLKQGVKPRLFTYGPVDDPEVAIARTIAVGEGLEFECIDKSRINPPEPDQFAAQVERDFLAFDGWKCDGGIFSSGADYYDRLRRHENGQVPINGSLGEIYRNFFYLPDRSFSAADLVSTFFSQYDPAAGGPLFDDRAYRSNLATSIRRAVNADSEWLTRRQVELAYPAFRGRYWTGHDAQINQRFGPMLFPYLESNLIRDTSVIPLCYKTLGRLQGEMTRLQHARLAAYPSGYGYPLGGPRPWKERMMSFLNNHRPPALRRHAFRLKNRAPQIRPRFMSEPYLSQAISTEFPCTREMFDLGKVYSNDQFNCVATLEYIGQRLNLGIKEERLEAED